MEALMTSLTTGLTSTADSLMGAIGSIVPIALPIMGGFAVVGIAIKIFHKVTGK